MRYLTPTTIIDELLQNTLHLSNWTITKPTQGQQKECYIARHEQLAVFIKFGQQCSVEILHRLGELDVAPRLLASGTLNDRQYIIQEYLAAEHPRWIWFADHLPLLARVTKRYHNDLKLGTLLAKGEQQSYNEHVASVLDRLSRKLATLDVDLALHKTLEMAYVELVYQTQDLCPLQLAPVHGDPNKANILITGDTFLLVDWDEIIFSDPLRDVGQWLGWYVPQTQWQVFYKEHSLPTGQHLDNNVFWWAALSSFGNVLWHIEQRYDYQVFLRDTFAALKRDIVPHPVFHDDA